MFGCLIAGVTGERCAASPSTSLPYAATVLIARHDSARHPHQRAQDLRHLVLGAPAEAANGVVSAGMALGFMIGALLSATVLSPLLGGWRNVIFFFAAIALAVGGFWAITRRAERTSPAVERRPAAPGCCMSPRRPTSGWWR